MTAPASAPPALLPLAVALIVALALIARPARGATEPDDPPAPGPRVDLRDVAPHDLWAAPESRAPVWVALEAQLCERASGARGIGAMLLLGLPLDRLARPRLATGIAQDAAPTLKPPPRPPRSARVEPPPDPSPVPPPARAPAEPEPPLPIPVVVTPEVARDAVHAALRHAHLADPDGRLDALASRARSSALLPELRLRATRLVDDAQNLSPTEYDPERTTASGGTSVWIEARATWRLDRLVFADEEVPIERMRYERAEAQSRLVAHVLELLFGWQRALALEADPGRTPEEHLNDSLKVIETEAMLDVVTDGWFTRWRRKRPAR